MLDIFVLLYFRGVLFSLCDSVKLLGNNLLPSEFKDLLSQIEHYLV